MSAADAVTGEGASPTAPLLRVVRGQPTEEELAALVVALTATAASAAPPPPPAARSGWASYADAIRAPLHPGPGAWVASARPR